MYKFLQGLTKFLSIKTIVILGVVIMATIIVAFGLTMTYLSSTIKYDQTTLKHILELEKQNQNVLNIIKDVNYINNKILVTNDIDELEYIENDLLNDVSFSKMIDLKSKLTPIKDYNTEINNIEALFNKIIEFQSDMYNSKLTILTFQTELRSHKEKIDNYTKTITVESESVYGKALLLTKRHNKKLRDREENILNDYLILDSDLLRDLSRVITNSTELEISVLRLPELINTILNTDNLDEITSIRKNNLSQLTLLVDNSIEQLSNLENLNLEGLDTSIDTIRSVFSNINDQISFIVSIKKLLLKEKNKLAILSENIKLLNSEIFIRIKSLNDISNEIKLEILNHSDSISKTTTITIIVVGFICLILLTVAATTLISRINVPLEFIIKFMDSIIGRKRKLSSKLPVFLDDEFGKLSKSFNEMTSTISNNIQEIKHLNKEIEDTQKEVIFTMGAIGETRSKETGNHVKRVAEYSKIFALKYGLDAHTAELLKEASPMHDIGKVGIPDDVLKKPGPLDDVEWEIMKTHAQLGHEMLKHSHRNILQAAAIVAYEHHEKWDGSGYPRGLKGEEIHIFGRITAVADVFDALGSDRCYKKAWPLADIKKFFKDNKGTHFDPKLVDIFFENIDEFIYVRDKYKDSFE